MDPLQFLKHFFHEHSNIVEWDFRPPFGFIVKVEDMDGDVDIFTINPELKGMAKTLDRGDFNVVHMDSESSEVDSFDRESADVLHQ